MTEDPLTGQDPDTRRIIAGFLDRRYNGVIPVTDDMVQAVMDGLAEERGAER